MENVYVASYLGGRQSYRFTLVWSMRGLHNIDMYNEPRPPLGHVVLENT